MAMNGTIRVITNDTGYAKNVQVAEGATVGEIFTKECGYTDPSKYSIKLRQADGSESIFAAREDLVHDGDMLIITPTNLKGN